MLVNLRRVLYDIVEELLAMIQRDPELWELMEQLKHQDEEPSDFILNVAGCSQLNSKTYTGRLNDKLDAFSGLPPKAFEMVPLFLHIALDIFMMRAIPADHQGG